MLKSEDLLAELEFEIVSTGKLLDLIPEDKLEWQPHPKAMNLGTLALHVATVLGGYSGFASSGSTDVNTLVFHPEPRNKIEILTRFKNSVAKVREILKTEFDQWAGTNWELTKNGEAIFTIQRSVMARLLVFNHWYHHRGQLNTYLRILGLKLPSVYGPSADEDPFA